MSSTGLNLTSLGLNSTSSSSGSGLDVTAVVNQILDAARGPERLWQRQQSGLTAQTNALNSINSSLTALQTAMQALSDVSGIVASKVANLIADRHSHCQCAIRRRQRRSPDHGN